MKIPSNNIWTQTNEGDISGILHGTRNVTLDTPGKVRLSQKAITLHNTTSLFGLEYGISIVYYNGKYTVVGSNNTYTFDLEGAATTTLTAGTEPTPTIYGDGIIFNNELHVTSDNDLFSWDGSIWTAGLESLTDNVPHPMEIFDSLTTFKLAIGNANTVRLLAADYSNATAALTLPDQYIVTTLAYRSGYLYVGTRNQYGGEARIFIWDGDSNNANYEVPVSGNWVYSIKPYLNSVCAILSSGELVYINGTTTQRLSALPVFYMPSVNWQGTLDSDFPRVFNRGMITDGDLIYLNINALVENARSQDYLPGFESGIWVFDPQNGLYHRASTNYQDKFVIDSSLSVTDSVITTAASHNLKTGDSVIFQTVSGLTGVDTLTTYYVSVESPTTLKLALSRRALQDNVYVTILGTAGASDKLVYSPNTEYFQYARVSSGAMALPTASDGYFKNWSTPIIWAASAQNFDIDERFFTLNVLADSYNIGYIETQRIYSENIEQSWKKITTFLDGLDLDNEEVIVKYRTEQESGYPTPALLGYWASTTQINFNKADCPFLKEGDELMLIDGTGRGRSVHIVGTPTSSSTVTEVIVDEAVGVASMPVRASATNYKKTAVLNLENKLKSYLTSTIDESSPWVQVKVEIRGFEVAINKFDLGNVIHKGVA
jgi:hypothetical protein